MPEGVFLAEMLRPLSALRQSQPPSAKPTETRNDEGQDAFRGALDDAVANRPQPHQKPAKPADAPAGDSRPETEQAAAPATDDSSKPQITTDEAAAMASTQTQAAPSPVVAPMVVPVVAPVVAPVIAATEPVVIDSQEQTATTESVRVASPVATSPASPATDLIPPPVVPKPRDDAKSNSQSALPLPEASGEDATSDQAEPIIDSNPVGPRKPPLNPSPSYFSLGRDLKNPNTGPVPEEQAVPKPVPTPKVESVNRAEEPSRPERPKHEARLVIQNEHPVDTIQSLPPRTSGQKSQPENGRTAPVRGRADKSHATVRSLNPFATTEAGNLNWQEVDSVSPVIRTGSGDSPAAGIARFLIESDAGTDRDAAVNPSEQDAVRPGSVSAAPRNADVGRSPSLSGSAAIESRSGVSQFLVSQSRAAETLEQAARVLASGGNGRYQVTMHLDPPDLGKLRLDVQMADQIMTLRVDVDSQDVARLIESKLSHLRDSLALHGIRIDRSEIAVRQSAGAEGGNTSSQDNSQNQSSNRESQSGSSHDSANGTAGQFAREGRERDAWGQGGFGSDFDDSFVPGNDSSTEHLAPVGAYSGDSLVDVMA